MEYHHHHAHQNVYQETDFDERQEDHVEGGNYKDDADGSSSESDFEYITEDSLLGHRSNLPPSRKTSVDLNPTYGTSISAERKFSSDDSMTVVDCDFKDVGCEARLPQKEMSSHLEQSVVYHLSIQAEAVKVLRAEKEELAAKYERLEMKHQQLASMVNDMLTAIEKLQLASPRDLATYTQTVEDDGVSKSLDRKPSEKSNGDRPGLPKSLTKSTSHFLLPTVPEVTPRSPRSKPQRPKSACCPLSTSESCVDDGSYINDDERPQPPTTRVSKGEENWQYSYILVEPISPLPLEVKQQAQKLTKLIMTNFEKHRRSGGNWISHPFYTHPQGYKMCLRVSANGQGSGKGTHITVAVYLMKGEFDNQLEWPFRGDITIQLLNQQGGDKDHCMRTISRAEAVRGSEKAGTSEKFISAWGISQFKSHGEIHQKYLKNDSLKFQVATVIKPSILSPLRTIKTQV